MVSETPQGMDFPGVSLAFPEEHVRFRAPAEARIDGTCSGFLLRSFNRRNGFRVLLEGNKCAFSHRGTLISQIKLDFQPKRRLGEYPMFGLVFVSSTYITLERISARMLFGISIFGKNVTF